MKRLIVVGCSAVALCAAFAETAPSAGASLTVNQVRQRYPWNGFVDVDYTVSGVADDVWAEDLHIDFTVHATTNGVAFSAPARHFATGLWFEMPARNGSYRVTWNAPADGFTFPVEEMSMTLTLVEDPVSEYEADYMTVDLSAGKSGSKPVRFLRAPNLSSEIFNTDAYKTTKLVLKRVPRGEFWMGEGDVSSGTSRHRVRLTDDFFLGVFQMTEEQYYRIVGSGGSSKKAKSNVNSLTLFGSSNVFTNLCTTSRWHGRAVTGFSLPTEAQWEYACRAGTDTKYFFGSDASLLPSYAVYAQGEVGTKLPNPWGFYDQYGNVWDRVYGSLFTYPPYGETEADVSVDPVYLGLGIVSRGQPGSSATSGGRGTVNVKNETFFTDTYAHGNNGFRLAKWIDDGK